MFVGDLVQNPEPDLWFLSPDFDHICRCDIKTYWL